MNNEKSNNNHSVAAFMIGATLGAAAALLFAPDSGLNTRDKIKTRFGKMKQKGFELIDNVGSKIRSGTDQVRGEVDRQVSSVRSAVNEGKTAYNRELGKQHG